MDKHETTKVAARGLITLLLLLLLGCGSLAYALWLLLRPLEETGLRAWAIGATLLLMIAVPGATVGGFLFGRREASVMTDGLRTGVNEVTRTADEITTFKDKAASRSRQPPVTVQVAAGALPAPQMFHKQLEGESERVDL